MILGVDPGGKGALVTLDYFGKLESFIPMPMTKTNKPYDAAEVDVNLLESYVKSVLALDPNVFAFCERPSSYGMLSSSAFTYGFNFALLSKVLERYCSNLTYVQSGTWTRVIHEGEDKDLKPKAKSLLVFGKLYSMEPKYLFGKLNKASLEGLVDAMLIAEYGRRMSK